MNRNFQWSFRMEFDKGILKLFLKFASSEASPPWKHSFHLHLPLRPSHSWTLASKFHAAGLQAPICESFPLFWLWLIRVHNLPLQIFMCLEMVLFVLGPQMLSTNCTFLTFVFATVPVWEGCLAWGMLCVLPWSLFLPSSEIAENRIK